MKLKQFFSGYIGDRAFYKRTLAIAIPMIIQNTVTNLVNLLDNLMVGSLGTEQMSGVAIVNMFIAVILLGKNHFTEALGRVECEIVCHNGTPGKEVPGLCAFHTFIAVGSDFFACLKGKIREEAAHEFLWYLIENLPPVSGKIDRRGEKLFCFRDNSEKRCLARAKAQKHTFVTVKLKV